MTSLLDVNVLVALLDANHVHHAASTAWLGPSNRRWASCPITQNGYLRLATVKGYPNAISPEEALKKLSQAVSSPAHEFLADDISLVSGLFVTPNLVEGHKQWTDIYLLALSVHHGMQFVTLDQHVPLRAVPQATDSSMHVISP